MCGMRWPEVHLLGRERGFLREHKIISKVKVKVAARMNYLSDSMTRSRA